MKLAVITPTAIGLALVTPISPLMAQEHGFIEDSSANLLMRNYYYNRDFQGASATRNKAEEWAQGFILDFRSGYTQGLVGFGLDVSAMSGFKLDSSPDRTGTELLPRHDDGRAPDSYGRAGVTFKAKLSATELKVGELRPDIPVLRADDGRLLPQTFEGLALTSREFEGLTLSGGQIRKVAQRNSTDDQDLWANRFPGVTSDRFNYVGAEYRFNQERTQVGVWQAQLKDIYQQRYYNLTHRQPVGDWTLAANLGYFVDQEQGSAKAGNLDSKAWGGLFSASTGPHTMFVGLQRVSEGTGWLALAGTSGKTMANDSYNNNFSNSDERSWQLRYDFNFVALGLPGLTSLVRYIHGSDANVGLVRDGTSWERDFELAYTVQSGPFKDVNLSWRNSSVRKSYGEDYDENRLVVAYNLNLF
ncbi:OprD family porin [Pseudomonas brenneri]|uniref:OprD family porin n=1 Tax=Pseudomonas brenneri TaxID=129817 RepID=UPI0028D56F72|nr:OprD family porin [Pseudomonas brenneri]